MVLFGFNAEKQRRRGAEIVLCVLCVLCGLNIKAQEIETIAATNLLITSNTTNELGWTRQTLMDGGEGKVVDPSGVVVSAADAAAQRTLAKNLQRVATATAIGVTNALSSLWAVTNLVPDNAHHVQLYFPRATIPLNLAAEVVEEGADGDTDWQVVKYSQLLTIPPNRHVDYVYPGGTATVAAVWDGWDASSYTHRCTFPRPAIVRGKLINSAKHDIIGGPKGFDFGSAIVTVNGKPTYTGYWTNNFNGVVYFFENGVNKIRTKEAKE